MRLLKTRTELPELEDFAADDIPLYAVLSHTWEKDEISFQDIQAIQRGDTAATRKPEYHKIAMTRAVAAAHGFDYVWIDTCCIDKMSSAELSEAINSMYRWYQEAAMCYAHLTDVVSPDTNPSTPYTLLSGPKKTAVNKELAASRWFTRGWTLQELIAPSMMVFLNTAWEEIGTKSDLGPVISKITRIPEAILQGAADLETASIAQRMSWAANRKTTRPEDIAYCLMGLFGVNMPMLYGEGEKAFIRLQEEIMKISSDHTLFAWGNRIQHIDSNSVATEPLGLLARSPKDFEGCHNVIPLVDSDTSLSGNITVSNKGVHLELRLTRTGGGPNTHFQIAVLPCTFQSRSKSKQQQRQSLGIFLKDVSGTGEYFERRSSHLLHVDYPRLPPHVKDPAARRICVRREHIHLKSRPKHPLMKAAEKGDPALVVLLLGKGAEADQASLLSAAKGGHATVVNLLITRGAKPDADVMLAAVTEGHEEVVRVLAVRGPHPSQECLLRAVNRGHRDMIKTLIHFGAVADQESLALAAKHGRAEVVRYLLENGAHVDTETVQEAVSRGHVHVLEFLMRKGGRLDDVVMSEAIANRHEAMVRFLLERGVEPDTSAINESENARLTRGLSREQRREAWRIQRMLLDEAAKKYPRLFRWAQTMEFGTDGAVYDSASDAREEGTKAVSSDGESSQSSRSSVE